MERGELHPFVARQLYRIHPKASVRCHTYASVHGGLSSTPTCIASSETPCLQALPEMKGRARFLKTKCVVPWPSCKMNFSIDDRFRLCELVLRLRSISRSRLPAPIAPVTHRAVFRTACALVRDSALAEDVTQEVFLRLYRRFDSAPDGEQGQHDSWRDHQPLSLT